MGVVTGGGGATGVPVITGFSVTMSANMTNPNTSDVMTFDTVLSDSAAYFNTSTHTATIPAGKAGYYALSIGPIQFGASGSVPPGAAGWVEFDTSGPWANLLVPLAGTTGTNNAWWGGGTVVGHYAVGDTIQAVLFPPLPLAGTLTGASFGLVWTAALVAL